MEFHKKIAAGAKENIETIEPNNKASILDLKKEHFEDQVLLAKFDYNVPLTKDKEITDPRRITETIPTINYSFEQGARSIVIMSHLGRPKGKYSEKDSLEPIAKELQKHLPNKKVVFIPMVEHHEDGMSLSISPDYQTYLKHTVPSLLKNPQKDTVYIIENVRFDAREEKNSSEIALEMAKTCPQGYAAYINDAFSAAHRGHASNFAITDVFKAEGLPVVSGLLINKELYYSSSILKTAPRRFGAIIGGAKVSSKLDALTNIIDKVDVLIIGGGMAYTFLKARGENIGKSLVEENLLETAKEIMRKAEEKEVDILLPIDNVCGLEFSNDTEISVVEQIPDKMIGLDIGPKTIELYSNEIKELKTVIWNGPMGAFEMPNFAAGTNAIAKALADSDCLSVVGGGDSASAVEQSGHVDKISYISTGGGAFLEILEGKKLDAIEALDDRSKYQQEKNNSQQDEQEEKEQEESSESEDKKEEK